MTDRPNLVLVSVFGEFRSIKTSKAIEMVTCGYIMWCNNCQQYHALVDAEKIDGFKGVYDHGSTTRH